MCGLITHAERPRSGWTNVTVGHQGSQHYSPYKSTFFKEYRVQFPAVDHGTAKVVSVFLYGRIVYVGYHMVCPKGFLDLEENVVRYHALHQELAVAR